MAQRGPVHAMHTAWRLYGHPRRLAAALGKAFHLLRRDGPKGLAASVRGKLRQPQLPVRLVGTMTSAEAPPLTYEDRWVLVGHGLSLQHSVSVIIPTKGNTARIADCLRLLTRSTLPGARLEVLIVNNGASLGKLPDIPYPLRILPEHRPFNWSEYNNRAASQSIGEYMLFLNDDVLPLHGGWLDAMLDVFDSTVGAVGAKLLYPSSLIQHIGISLEAGPEGGHEFKFEARDCPGSGGELLLPRCVDAATGACLLTPRSLFSTLRGFDPCFAESYNDVDYCLRLHQCGHRIMVTPFAELLHTESATRPLRVLPDEKQLFHDRWLRGSTCSRSSSGTSAADAQLPT